MTPDEAEALAQRILAVIHDGGWSGVPDYMRERVASDLAGLRQHGPDEPLCSWSHDASYTHDGDVCDDALRYAAGLRRTAALYGVSL